MAGTNKKLGGGGFHHVALRVQNFEASLKFYTEGLGCVQKSQWGEPGTRMTLLDTGDGNFMELCEGGTAGPRPEGSYVHIALRTDNCARALELANAAGAKITVPASAGSLPGLNTPVVYGFCSGPEGESIEFLEMKA